MLKLLTIFFTFKAMATPVVSDLTLVQIATNTLNSVRELNNIVREQREFGENFERVYSKIDVAIWKADRTSIWLEDMNNLRQADIHNIDDFNYVLRSLKDETSYLRKRAKELYNEQQKQKNNINEGDKDAEDSKKRARKYSTELKGSMSPTQAQVETAKNTKDMLVEMAKMNSDISKIKSQLGTLNYEIQEQEKRRAAKVLNEDKKLNPLDRGVVKPHEVRVK